MYYDFPSYVWALVLLGVTGIPAATSIMLYRGAVAARLGRRTGIIVAVAAAAVPGGWILASGLPARAGVYHQASGEAAPWFGVAFAATLIALLLATRISIAARILDHAGTPARLALPHTLRIVGVAFLIAMAQGDLPAVFALPAGLGDIAIGVSAPFVARRLAQRQDHKGALRFNLLGILDLVVALSIGFLAGLGPYRPAPTRRPGSLALPRAWIRPLCRSTPAKHPGRGLTSLDSSARRLAVGWSTCWRLSSCSRCPAAIRLGRGVGAGERASVEDVAVSPLGGRGLSPAGGCGEMPGGGSVRA